MNSPYTGPYIRSVTRSPCRRVEPEQVGVEYLGGMVQASRLAGEEEDILPALVRAPEPALLDVDLRRAVLAHGPQLGYVALWGVTHNRPDEIKGYLKVVVQGQPSLVVPPHGIRHGRLLRVVDHCIGAVLLEKSLHK